MESRCRKASRLIRATLRRVHSKRCVPPEQPAGLIRSPVKHHAEGRETINPCPCLERLRRNYGFASIQSLVEYLQMYTIENFNHRYKNIPPYGGVCVSRASSCVQNIKISDLRRHSDCRTAAEMDKSFGRSLDSGARARKDRWNISARRARQHPLSTHNSPTRNPRSPLTAGHQAWRRGRVCGWGR